MYQDGDGLRATYLDVVVNRPAAPVPCDGGDLVQKHENSQVDSEEVLRALARHHSPELLEQLLSHRTQGGAVPHVVELGTDHSGDKHVIGVRVVAMAPVWLHVEMIITLERCRPESVSCSGVNEMRSVA